MFFSFSGVKTRLAWSGARPLLHWTGAGVNGANGANALELAARASLHSRGSATTQRRTTTARIASAIGVG